MATAVMVAALLVSGGIAEAAGQHHRPKPGTYSGAGPMVGDPSRGMQVGWIFEAGGIDIRILGFTLPGCSGFISVPATTVAAKKFQISSSGGNSEANTLKGHWANRTTVKGKLTLERPSAASCGDPGTYVYRYKARRYGRP